MTSSYRFKFLSVFLAFVLVASCFPASAFADEVDTEEGSDTTDQGIVVDPTPEGDDPQAEPSVEEEPQASASPTADAITPDNYSDQIGVSYKTHVQTYGWLSEASDGDTAGTTGQAKRVEALSIELEDGIDGGIEYRAHVQTYGWQDWVSDGATAGTTNQAKRLEALSIRLTGDIADDYDVYYRVHCQYYGWLDWAKNGEAISGTSGMNLRTEALEIIVIHEDETPPQAGTLSYVSKANVSYSAHAQTYGWLTDVSDGATAGTTGQSKRLEAFKASYSSATVSGGITYSAHVQNIGWQSAVSDGTIAGTVGQTKRLEAMTVELTGDAATYYDVYYRVHSQRYGWLDWAKNGANAGTSGIGFRNEALQIKIVPKGSPAPGTTSVPYVAQASVSYSAHVQTYGWQDWVSDKETAGTSGESKRIEALKMELDSNVSGSIQYSAHVQSIGWQSAVSDGAIAGTTGQSKRVEAISVKLTGQAASYYDVYYRVHSQTYGWLGWAKNGAYAGTANCSYRAEAIQVAIVARGSSAPGSTTIPYTYYRSTGDSALDQKIYTIAKANGDDLRKCFDYVAKFKYIKGSTLPTGSWMVPFAKEMIQNNGGNCYRYAALFGALAHALGYDATVVSGWVPSVSQGKAPHGWVEIKMSGKTYICDPDMVHAYPTLNWYMRTYSNAPLTYGRW